MVSVILFLVPLVTHYYLSKYESSSMLGLNAMHNLDSLADISTVNPDDLKLRIKVMLRIKTLHEYKTWNTLVGGKLETESDYTYNRKVCDKHFTDRDRNRYKRLNALAVPSLHLLDNFAVLGDSNRVSSKNQALLKQKKEEPKIPYFDTCSEICRLRKRAKSFKDRLSLAAKLCKVNAFGEVVKNMSK
ncbi:unnamed protein product [Pieris macdunnoughi]|uniref:THAP-type domain-containing protein n=1 Tax=Pieris macdunnoughi TaxID=345717 RepID=A0A821XFP2_9NEOP|nr:unnamed protein product [Pieris macdunnoughi]